MQSNANPYYPARSKQSHWGSNKDSPGHNSGPPNNDGARESAWQQNSPRGSQHNDKASGLGSKLGSGWRKSEHGGSRDHPWTKPPSNRGSNSGNNKYGTAWHNGSRNKTDGWGNSGGGGAWNNDTAGGDAWGNTSGGHGNGSQRGYNHSNQGSQRGSNRGSNNGAWNNNGGNENGNVNRNGNEGWGDTGGNNDNWADNNATPGNTGDDAWGNQADGGGDDWGGNNGNGNGNGKIYSPNSSSVMRWLHDRNVNTHQGNQNEPEPEMAGNVGPMPGTFPPANNTWGDTTLAGSSGGKAFENSW